MNKKDLPSIIYAHGGGGVKGSAEMDNYICARIAVTC